jgi:acyl-CoA synthetase (AMP-forming)/AMP-acid ligase II
MEIYGMQKDMIVAGGYNIYPKEIDEVPLRPSDLRYAAMKSWPRELCCQT